MGSSDLADGADACQSGVPVVTVAAFFQRDPQVLIAHADVTVVRRHENEDHPDRRQCTPGLLAVAEGEIRPGRRADPALHLQHPALRRRQESWCSRAMSRRSRMRSRRPASRRTSSCSATSAFRPTATTVSCMEIDDLKRPQGCSGLAFVKASAEGWKSYLANPAPGNALIKHERTRAISDDQLAYSVAKLKSTGHGRGWRCGQARHRHRSARHA